MTVQIGEISPYAREVVSPKVMVEPWSLAAEIKAAGGKLTGKDCEYLKELATQAHLRLQLASSAGEGWSYLGPT